MNKRANKDLFLAKIVIAIALIAILGAVLWGYFGQDTVAVQNAKEAYAQYISENPGSLETDFIYIWSDKIIIAIRNGEVVGKQFTTEADAVKAATGSKDGADYTLSSTNNEKLYSVKLFERMSDIYAVGSQTLAAGARAITIKVVSSGKVFATFEIPAEAIAQKNHPVNVTIKKINPEDNIKLGKNETGFAYDIGVTNLIENNTALIRVTMNGPKGLAAYDQNRAITVYHKNKPIASTYDPAKGEISFETTNFSPYTFTYEEITVKSPEELRFYLQREGTANIKLAGNITINMAGSIAEGGRETTNQDAAGTVVSYEHKEAGATKGYMVNYARAYINGKWMYFGAMIRGEKMLDLNGFTITYSGNTEDGDGALFCVNNAGFTVIDSTDTNGTNGTGRIEMELDQYAVWSVNDSATVNIHNGIFVSEENLDNSAESDAALLYSSGGKIHVYGGYYIFGTADNGYLTGCFNVINQIQNPRIWVYEGVRLSHPDYRQGVSLGGGRDDNSIVIVGGASVSGAEAIRDVAIDSGVISNWYTVSGQQLGLDAELNTDKYLYRVGNLNAFPLGAFFNELNGTFSGSVNVRVVDVIATKEYLAANPYDKNDKLSGYYEYIADKEVSGYTYKAGATWDASTVQIPSTFTGPVRLEVVNADGVVYASVNLEVVDGKNMTTSSISPSSSNKNVCLLNDLETGSTISISNGYAFFGNGFTITDKRGTTTGSAGLVIINNGTVDNLKLDGYQSTTNSASISENGRAPAMSISGTASIYNSYIQGGRQAILCNTTANVYMKNVTLDGGSRANMEIVGGNVTLENCTTTVDTTGGLKGMGILVASTNVKLTLDGTLTQYNWVKSSDLPSAYSIVLSDYFSDATHSYSSHLNMGVFFMVESVEFTIDQVKTQLVDNTGNDYGYIQKTASGYTATAYIPKKSLGDTTFFADPKDTPAYETLGNYPIAPHSQFDHEKAGNYVPKSDGSNEYAFYNTLGYVDISFEKGGSKVWNTDILTANKFGKPLQITVSMNGTDYTGKTITFTSGSTTVTLIFSFLI